MIYESLIKVDIHDEKAKRRRDIEDGIGYTLCILRDEYGATPDELVHLLEHEIDTAMEAA